MTGFERIAIAGFDMNLAESLRFMREKRGWEIKGNSVCGYNAYQHGISTPVRVTALAVVERANREVAEELMQFPRQGV